MKYSGTLLTVNVYLAVLNEHFYEEMYYTRGAQMAVIKRGSY